MNAFAKHCIFQEVGVDRLLKQTGLMDQKRRQKLDESTLIAQASKLLHDLVSHIPS